MDAANCVLCVMGPMLLMLVSVRVLRCMRDTPLGLTILGQGLRTAVDGHLHARLAEADHDGVCTGVSMQWQGSQCGSLSTPRLW